MYITLLFWITGNLCIVPGMLGTFHVKGVFRPIFLKEGYTFGIGP